MVFKAQLSGAKFYAFSYFWPPFFAVVWLAFCPLSVLRFHIPLVSLLCLCLVRRLVWFGRFPVVVLWCCVCVLAFEGCCLCLLCCSVRFSCFVWIASPSVGPLGLSGPVSLLLVPLRVSGWTMRRSYTSSLLRPLNLQTAIYALIN